MYEGENERDKYYGLRAYLVFAFSQPYIDVVLV